MSRLLTVALLVLVLGVSISSAAEEHFGKKLTQKKITKISDILKEPKKYEGKKVVVKGTVVDVCQKRGCWIFVASDVKFQKMRMQVEDGVIVFPMSVRGKTAMVEGTVVVEELDKEEALEKAKHHAEEKGEKFDPASVKYPAVEVLLEATGAVVTDR